MLKSVIALCLVGVVVCGPPVSRSREEIQKFRDYLEGTRTDRGVILPSSRNKNPSEGSLCENSGKYQGDILLDDDQIESMVEQFALGRNAYIWPNTRWPSRTVVYQFAPGHFDAAGRDLVMVIMRALEDRTCIRFRQRHAGDINYVLLTSYSDGCYARVGYWATRGIHTMNLARNRPGHGCMGPILITHELLHVIGFFHMQSSNDRDNFVRINWQNIAPGMEHNFDRHGTDIVSNLGLPYEYDSCMHYGSHAFSSNGRSTMDALRPHNGVMGQMNHVTSNDFRRVDWHYGCFAKKQDSDYKPMYFHEFANFTAMYDMNDENEAKNEEDIAKIEQ